MKRIVRRVWPAAVWLGVWQAGSMAFAAIYPHGALLLASPLASLKALCGMAGTAAFWTAAASLLSTPPDSLPSSRAVRMRWTIRSG